METVLTRGSCPTPLMPLPFSLFSLNTHTHTYLHVQVEADIRPFRGLLIGLFFMSVGGSINMDVLAENYDVILWMLAGLVSLKAAVNIALGPLFGLSKCGAPSALTWYSMSCMGISFNHRHTHIHTHAPT
jgi:Kef-type K+ transport system membrane component KefB